MATRVLILHPKLVFAVTLKQALEQTGAFEVHPFTTIQATLEYLREHPQDVALVDFSLPDANGTQLVRWLRSTQPDLAIIASPRPADANEIMAALKIQGMVNPPFTAREIIPLLEQAVETMQRIADDTPPRPITLPGIDPSEDTPVPPIAVNTRILDDAPQPPAQQPSGTRILEDDPGTPAPPTAPFGKTRILDDVQPDIPEAPYAPEYGSTRKLDESPPPPHSAQPRRLIEEPPIEEGDTPAVPTRNSEATRQFLASKPSSFDSLFDDVLDVIDAELGIGDEDKPENEDEDSSQGDSFKGMIKSLSRPEPDSSLPERQKQGMDFTYTSGMDTVLREIARTKTAPLPDVDAPPPGQVPDMPPSTFEKLAQEEPPMPTLEDSGTIGDLMVGISDNQFRNVLAMLRGEEPHKSSADIERATIEEAFAGVFWPGESGEQTEETPVPPPTLPEVPPPPKDMGETTAGFNRTFDQMDYIESFDEEAGDATVPQVILEAALDESTPPGDFSLNRLIDDIDARLSIHKLAIRGLPSWDQETGAFRAVDMEGIREPDFLPDELPMGEMVTPDLPRLEDDDEAVFTTQPSKATREALQEQGEQSSVTLEWVSEGYTEDTAIAQSQSDTQADTLLDAIEADDEPGDFTPLEPLDNAEWGEETPLPTETGSIEPETIPEAETPEEMDWLDEGAFTAGEVDTVFDGYGRFDDVPGYDDGYVEPEATSIEAEIEPEDEWLDETPPVYDENTWLQPLLEKPEKKQETQPEAPFTEEPIVFQQEEVIEEPDTFQQEEVIEEPVVFQQEEVIEEPVVFQQEEVIEEPIAFQQEEVMAAPEDVLSAWDASPTEEDLETTTRPLDIPAEIVESQVHTAWDIAAHEEVGSTTQPLEIVDSWDEPGEETSAAEVPPEKPDSNVAQLAVTLTQASLDVSAEATLLTHHGEIIAYAGHLTQDDVEELRAAIENDWDAQPEGARIRFVTLPSSGKDYMLYSILTQANLTLSMIFSSETPLRVIRKQGQILADALRHVPEVPPPPVVEPPATPVEITPVTPVQEMVEVAVRQAFSYVWLLRDPDNHLPGVAAQAMISGLTLQLSEQGWQIITLQVHEDFIYLLAEVPGDTPPNLVMTDLKRRSAEIARAQIPNLDVKTLWADSYLILTPGRELETEEILEFINFQRML
ncbi:MAG: response regulator [Anaerolineaceae bacterium]|nr:response regulator [Anaerolineaceae bacterium]